jgi:hypothetical protein
MTTTNSTPVSRTEPKSARDVAAGVVGLLAQRGTGLEAGPGEERGDDRGEHGAEADAVRRERGEVDAGRRRAALAEDRDDQDQHGGDAHALDGEQGARHRRGVAGVHVAGDEQAEHGRDAVAEAGALTGERREQRVEEGPEDRCGADREEEVRAEEREAGDEPGPRPERRTHQRVGAAGVVVPLGQPDEPVGDQRDADEAQEEHERDGLADRADDPLAVAGHGQRGTHEAE